jgi:hypothetical protein
VRLVVRAKKVESGIYIVTLNNLEPISVNAQDPRIAHKVIKVTKANCKVGKAKNLNGREKNYYKTFGEENVNFYPVAKLKDIESIEKQILSALDIYRIKGRTGRKNEWLQDITPEVAVNIVLSVIELSGEKYELLYSKF